MAIAADAVAASTGSSTGFTTTVAHDAGSGTDRYLIVVVFSSTANITGVTYNAVPMTKLDDSASGSTRLAIWGLPDPATGTHNIIVTNSDFATQIVVAKTYTGVDEPTTPDSVSGSTATAIFTTSLTMSTTTVADNAWCFYAIQTANTSAHNTAGAGSTLVGQILNATYGSISLYQNGPKTPAGAVSMTVNHASNTNFIGTLVSLAPETEVGGGAALSKLTLLGVG